MAEERRDRKRKKEIEKILTKLTPDQQEFLSELEHEERAEIFEFFSHYTAEEIEILRKVEQHEPVTDEEMEFAYDVGITEIEAIDTIFYDIATQLTIDEIELLLLASIKYPDVFKPIPVPTPRPPTPSEAIPVVKKIEEIKKIPYKWRSQFPFQTSTFIKQFLEMRATNGAYPYEIYKAYKNLLWMTITDISYRKEIIEEGKIKLDDEMVNGILSKQIKVPLGNLNAICPGIHIATYTSFWKYFMILNFLGLIKKKGLKIKSDKSIFDRQYYSLNKKLKGTRLWEEGWKHPQSLAYPLAGIGKKGYDLLINIAEREETTIQEVFIDEEQELIKEIAEIRNISVTELEEQIRNSEYHY